MSTTHPSTTPSFASPSSSSSSSAHSSPDTQDRSVVPPPPAAQKHAVEDDKYDDNDAWPDDKQRDEDDSLAARVSALQLGGSDDNIAHRFASVSTHHLTLGEGNFSHAAARIRKYGVHALIATELDEAHTVASRGERDAATLERSRELLERSGVTLLFDVDATCIDANPRLHPSLPLLTRYPRLSFHMPFVSKGASTTERVVAGFFRAASRVQRQGDRVDMALVATPHYLDQVYRVRTASSEAGYELRGRTPFLQRFQLFGYVHSTSTGNKPSHSSEHALVYRFRKRFEPPPPASTRDSLLLSCPRAQLMRGIFDLVHHEHAPIGLDDNSDTDTDMDVSSGESDQEGSDQESNS